MKLIIAGSRDITDYNIVRKAVIDMGLWKQYGKQIEVVCGMARGVDLEGWKFAKKNGLVIHEFPADWNNKGRGAGHIRNKEMGNFADELLAIWDGKSRGTKQMIEYMQSLGKPTHVFICEATATQHYIDRKGL